MDKSQSSDIFSDSGEQEHTEMDMATYEALITNTKSLLSKNINTEVLKTTFSDIFVLILNDCETCVTQSLDLILDSLSEPEVNLPHLCEYLDNAVNILRLLCCYLTVVIETTSMACSSMKAFPTVAGNIIMTVFTHCKDSDAVYGNHLKSVERQLKDLFRNCHELQLTYLVVLEKHFIFDLTVYEQQCVLIEALEINLKIGEIVQTLDVKTMAEQWKAYTVICEKYSDYLMNKHIYEDCIKVLSKMTRNNIRTSLGLDHEDKMVVRSLKVASFTIKIILRVCNIFKHATNKNYEHLVELLFDIFLNNSSYLEPVGGKSHQFVNLISNIVLNPAEALLKELLADDNFIDFLSKYEIESIGKEDKILSYILITISAMTQGASSTSVKYRILDCIFKWLPYGHTWFNMGLKFKSTNGPVTFGLYEHLLMHTYVMACQFDAEEIVYLEQKMYESLLGRECYSALFSSDLWELLARCSSRQYLLSQTITLCKAYQKLEHHKTFRHSPQQAHLSHTINRLFKTLHLQDKVTISKLFKITEATNISLWTVLGIGNSNIDQNEIIKKLKMHFDKQFASRIQSLEEIDDVVNLMQLAATASFDPEHKLKDDVIKAWMMLCPDSNKFFLSRGPLDRSSLWSLQYIEALVALTMSMLHVFRESACFVKVLHVVSGMIERGNTELKLVLINLLIKLSQHQCRDENKHLVEELLIKTFKFLLQDGDRNVRNKFWAKLWKHRNYDKVERILSSILNSEPPLQEKWNKLNRNGDLTLLKDNLTTTLDLQFSHKCIENETIELSDSDMVSNIEKTNSNNFDFADIDTLFEVESDSEPACKRIKLESNEAEDIIARLENEVTLLCNVKENVFTNDCKVRIRVLCEKLVGIID